MPEGKDNEELEENTAATEPVGGERLAIARREQQISVLEVAKELHLDEAKVRALERNEFEVLGAPVFAKGHLRKYAQLVGVDEDDLFTDYFKLNRAQPVPPIVVGRRRQRQELSPGPWIAAIIVILVAAAGYWWFGVREVPEQPAPALPAPVSDPVQQAEPERMPDVPDDTLVLGVADTGQPGLDTAGQLEPAAVLTAEPAGQIEQGQVAATAAALPEGQLQLAVSFSGDCWTEISDADGRRLFFGMGRAGRDISLTGTAPISALFGNVDNVSVRVNGRPQGFDSAERRGRTARLSITGQ